jgi:hypothetical protein
LQRGRRWTRGFEFFVQTATENMERKVKKVMRSKVVREGVREPHVTD